MFPLQGEVVLKPTDMEARLHRVFARVRPLAEEDEQAVWAASGREVCVVQHSCERRYRFEGVFSELSSQNEVFEAVCRPAVIKSLSGDAAVIAYGQTGSGKTYSMVGDEFNPGMIPRATELLFQESKVDSCRVSYVEIYNDKVFDLLSIDESKKSVISVRTNAEGVAYAAGAERVEVSKLEEVRQIFAYGARNRIIRATEANDQSSRSHTIFEIETQKGRLRLVDLAGSEKFSHRKSTPDRVRELTQINRSLTCLGKCVGALATRKAHVPYRESQLTRLLRDALASDATAFLVAIVPTLDAVDESLSTLDFAKRAMRVPCSTTELARQQPLKEKPSVATLRAALKEATQKIKTLEATLQELRGDIITSPSGKSSGLLESRVADLERRQQRDDQLKSERDAALANARATAAQLRKLKAAMPKERTPLFRRQPRRRQVRPAAMTTPPRGGGLTRTATSIIKQTPLSSAPTVSPAADIGALVPHSDESSKRTRGNTRRKAVTRHLDKATSIYYYFDRRTRQSSWDPPSDWETALRT